MNSSVSTQESSQISRTVIESFENEFASLDSRTRELVQNLPEGILYQTAFRTGTSVGELVLRSAAAVEQTCGGLTANLWDDPFEWTLPETLSTRALVIEYLDEVTSTRKKFFSRLRHDADLAKLIAVPAGETQPLVRLLMRTLVRATGYLERAAVIRKASSE